MNFRKINLSFIQLNGDSSTGTWNQVEVQTGVSVKTLTIFLREAKTEFPDWYDFNNPPKSASTGSLKRCKFRLDNNLEDRSKEWKNRCKLTRLNLIQQEKDAGHTTVKELSAIFDVPYSSIAANSMSSFLEYMDHKFKVG